MTQVGNLAERAVKLFDTDVLTLRQAAKLAGEPLATFTEALQRTRGAGGALSRR
jgi:predicted HTH domain antitoxin